MCFVADDEDITNYLNVYGEKSSILFGLCLGLFYLCIRF